MSIMSTILSRNISFFVLLFFCSLTCSPSQAKPTDTTDNPVLVSLVNAVRELTSIQASFSQETRHPMFTTPLMSQGRFAFQRPDSLLWEYTAPFVEGFSITGKESSKWQGSRANTKSFATESDPLTATLAEELIHWITLDLEKIQQSYLIEVIADMPPTIRLTPKTPTVQKIINNLTISFAENGVAKEVRISEKSSGGMTIISFSNIVTSMTPSETF